MAYGLHWEWRGFGTLAAGARASIEQLKAQFPEPDHVTDEYLWVPGLQANVKLRSKGTGSLKFKRLREVDPETRIELWEERPEEEYGFPVAPDAVSKLGTALGLRLNPPLSNIGRDELLSAMRLAAPQLKVCSVSKERRARIQQLPNGNLIIEIAEIEAPQRITTVAVEDEFHLDQDSTPDQLRTARQAVVDAVKQHHLEESMAPMNYVKVVERWATGGTV